jgi:uncharacterized membrane protein YccC
MQQSILTFFAWDRINFALRQWLAAAVTLYICFALQIESPYWALLAVWIVAQPAPGMVLAKSMYFVCGTIVGAALGFTLIALFAQAPELFVLYLALLVAGCTVASNLLTNFRAYGTVLIGYTAGIVAAGAIDSPDQVFFIAVARATSILIGISCSIVVTAVFAPHRSEAKVREKLQVLLKDAAHRAVYSWKADNEMRLQIGRKLIVDVIALNTQIEFAAAEAGSFRLHANQARSLLAHIFGLISARRSLDAHLTRCGWPKHAALQVFHGIIIDFLNELPQRLDRGEIDPVIAQLNEVCHQLALLQPENDSGPAEEVVSQRVVIDRLEDLLQHFERALKDWRDILRGQWQEKARLSLNFHRDHRVAWINGLRAFLAVGVTGAFWIASAWTHGTLALIFVAVLMSLFSALPHPDRVGWTFFRVGIFAVIFGLICKFLILSMGSDFEVLSLALGIFFIPLALVMANPPTAQPALSFVFVFVYMVRPDNVMTYDLADSLNTGVGVLVGVLIGTLCYRLIFPPDPRAARNYVTYRIRYGLEQLARTNPIPHFCSWESRMYDRVSRLNDPQNLSGTPTDAWLDASLGALTLGNELIRLRRWVAQGDVPVLLTGHVSKVIDSFQRFLSDPKKAVAALRSEAQIISGLDPGVGHAERRWWARVSGALGESDFYLTHNPLLTAVDSTAPDYSAEFKPVNVP